MKKKEKLGLVVMAAVTLSAASFLAGSSMSADEKKVYIPNDELRAEIIEQIKWNPETGEEEIIENELPTVDLMGRLDSINISNATSLEGFQYAENIRYLSYSPSENQITDFRPVAALKNLETFNSYAFGSETQYKPFDISAFKELSHLRNVHLGYYASVFDFSPLTDLENLESFTAVGFGTVEFPAVYVSRATKQLMMEHPVTYSPQFDGDRTVEGQAMNGEEYLQRAPEISLSGSTVTISSIDEQTTKINLTFSGQSTDGRFSANTDCVVPIVWY